MQKRIRLQLSYFSVTNASETFFPDISTSKWTKTFPLMLTSEEKWTRIIETPQDGTNWSPVSGCWSMSQTSDRKIPRQLFILNSHVYCKPLIFITKRNYLQYWRPNKYYRSFISSQHPAQWLNKQLQIPSGGLITSEPQNVRTDALQYNQTTKNFMPKLFLQLLYGKILLHTAYLDILQSEYQGVYGFLNQFGVLWGHNRGMHPSAVH